MRLIIILLALSLFSACVAEEKTSTEAGQVSKDNQANSPEVMKALGEKDCDEKAKAKKVEEHPESIGLGKGSQGCTLE